MNKGLNGLYKNNNLEQLAEILFQQYTILRDDKFQHDGNHHRSTQFDAGVNYYQVDKMNAQSHLWRCSGCLLSTREPDADFY